jgi:hypothetical protein
MDAFFPLLTTSCARDGASLYRRWSAGVQGRCTSAGVQGGRTTVQRLNRGGGGGIQRRRESEARVLPAPPRIGGTVAGGWRDLSGARGDFGVLPAARPATPPPTQSQSKRERDGTEEEEQEEEPAASAPFFFSGWIRREGYKCHSTYCYVCQRGTK